MTFSTRTTFLLFAMLTACGDDESEPNAGEDPAEHACEHVTEEATELTAGEARDETAPRVELGEEPYSIALDDSEPRYVRFEIDEHAEAILFASAEDVVTGLYHEDDEESLESAGANEHCEDEIPEHFDLDLHEAGTYYLRLGPSALADVWVMLTEAGGHAH